MKRWRELIEHMHEDYHQILQTVEERQMSIIYLRDQVKLYQDFKERIELRSNGKQQPHASQSRSGSGTASV